MALIQSISNKIASVKKWFSKTSLKTKVIFIIIISVLGWILYPKISGKKTSQPQYQTAQAEVGTLIVSLTASGQVSSANSSSIGTQASGVVKKMYVTNGQKVQSGTPIAEIDLDMEGKQRSAQALSSYQSAKSNLENAKADLFTTQSTMMTKWKTFMDTAVSTTYQNGDGTPKNDARALPQFISTDDDWLGTEAKFKNQTNIVNQTQTALNSTWLSYQQSSPIIYAPITGTITGFSLQIGSVLTSQANANGAATSQKVASIKTDATPTVTINLTEIDAPKVKVGNKATLTFDALAGKTFTGQVISIDTVGIVSSGVTTYPTVIKLDTDVPDIFSNMSATANIITQVKDNALLVPTSAVQTQNGQTFVRVMKDRKVSQAIVETGLTSSSQTEITSGISESDTVVISTVTTGSQQRTGQTSTSPFSAFGGRGGFGGR